MSSKIIVYGRPGCPMVPPVRTMLEQAKIGFDYVDISADAAARERVREINHGYESVPTLLFPDGSTLTEPSIPALRSRLQAAGYELPEPTLAGRIRGVVGNPLTALAGVVLLVAGLAAGKTALIILGFLLLAAWVFVHRL